MRSALIQSEVVEDDARRSEDRAAAEARLWEILSSSESTDQAAAAAVTTGGPSIDSENVAQHRRVPQAEPSKGNGLWNVARGMNQTNSKERPIMTTTDKRIAKEGEFPRGIEFEVETKVSHKMKVGTYRISSENRICRFVFVPSGAWENHSLTVEDIFNALGIDMPNLIFLINQSDDVAIWNVRVPKYKSNLEGSVSGSKSSGLQHYRSVIQENCKRLLKGTAAACEQAGAIIELVPTIDPNDATDTVGEWIGSTPMNLLGVEDIALLPDSFVKMLLDKEVARHYTPKFRNATDVGDEDPNRVLKIDAKKHYSIGSYMDMAEVAGRGIPHPKLTHLILTDNKFLLAKMMKNCSPIFIFKYTGGAADLAIEMLEKVDRWQEKKRLNVSARPEQPFRIDIPDDQVYRHPQWIFPFDDVHKRVCRTLNILIENFPDRYNPSTILRIDMFRTSEERLQDQLTKTMAVVFEGVAELGGQSAETRRLTYAWRLTHNLAYNAKWQRRIADIMNAMMILITVAATCTAVLYTFLQQTTNAERNMWRILALDVLLKLNLLLPLAGTITRGFYAALNPLSKWSALSVAKVMVESEIYMYRTKVGNYNARKNVKNNANQTPANAAASNTNIKKDKTEELKTTQANPRKVFSSALDSIWLDLSASAISKDALYAPPTSESPLDEVNGRLLDNIRLQKLLLDPLPVPLNRDAKSIFRSSTGRPIASHTVSLPSLGKSPEKSAVDRETIRHRGDRVAPTIEEEVIHALQHEGQQHQPHVSLHDSMANETTSKPNSPKSSHSASSSRPSTSDYQGVVKMDVENGQIVVQDQSRTEVDDGLTTLTADEFVKIRLIPFVAEYTSMLPGMTRRNNSTHLFMITMSVLSSVLSTFNLCAFIPAVLAVGSGVLAWSEFKQTDLRVGQTNAALHQLHKLLIWWDGLTMIERRVPTHKEILVQTTEAAIQSQVVNYASAAKNYDDDDDDK